MADGSFQLRDVEWSPARVALVVLMLVTAGTHFALATTTQQMRFAALSLGLLVCFVVFFTDVWRPAFHLLGALYVGVMAAVWFLTGMPLMTLGLADTAIQVVLVGLFVYLLFADRRDVDPSG